MGNFNPLPPRGGRRLPLRNPAFLRSISIHSLQEEGDVRLPVHGNGDPDFNPLPPRGGRRACRSCSSSCDRFQSTPSKRRETWLGGFSIRSIGISIHSLQEEGDTAPEKVRPRYYISIHSLQEEGDEVTKQRNVISGLFQSTPSKRRET